MSAAPGKMEDCCASPRCVSVVNQGYSKQRRIYVRWSVHSSVSFITLSQIPFLVIRWWSYLYTSPGIGRKLVVG